MGRALYSTYVAPEPAIVRSEPAPEADICERYSLWNRFDPDSEEFFQNAQYEAFIDPAQPGATSAFRTPSSVFEDSESSEGGTSDQASPMALGFDDTAVLISDAYRTDVRNGTWGTQDAISLIEPEWLPSIGAPIPISFSASSNSIRVGTASDGSSVDDSAPPPFIPPVIFREPSPAIDAEQNLRRTAPPSPTMRRTVSITPISVSVIRQDEVEESPSPRTPSPPSTPPVPVAYQQHISPHHYMVSPSPPPSATPRFYTWDRPTVGSPSSPTRSRAQQRDGPLTHPRARMSFTRIEASPVALTTLGR